MHRIKWFLSFALSFFIAESSFAQNQAIQLTAAIKADVIDSLSSVLLKKYIYMDTAVKMAGHIKERLKSGAYQTINNPDDFAQALKSDLYAVYPDLHLSVFYNPGLEKALRTKSYMESVTRRIKFLKLAKRRNYGFPKVEILDGNIGYLSITQFYDVNEQSAEAVQNAFAFLKNTDGLIIDVRDNPGGEPDMVKYICSYFFKEKTHLNDFYDRHNKTNQYWTDPLPASAIFSLIPIYVLINGHTGSAAEEFTYDLQSLHRATIVGQKTAGAAHWVASNSISNGFIGNIPFRKAVNPVTRTNWEKVGVKPGISCDAETALDVALMNVYNYQINTSKDTDAVKSARWLRVIINSKLHPVKMNIAVLKTFVGDYKSRLITFEKGRLYFTDTNGYKIGLNALSPTAFVFTNNDHQIEFYKDKAGKINEMAFIYQDGRLQKFSRGK